MVKIINGGMNITVSLHLPAAALKAIELRYVEEHGVLAPPRTSRRFQEYCRHMVQCAVGAAGANGWEEGAV